MSNKRICEHEKEHLLAMQRVGEDVLSKNDVEKISRIFHVLSDPNRLSIVLALMKGEMCVYHLTEVCMQSVWAKTWNIHSRTRISVKL